MLVSYSDLIMIRSKWMELALRLGASHQFLPSASFPSSIKTGQSVSVLLRSDPSDWLLGLVEPGSCCVVVTQVQLSHRPERLRLWEPPSVKTRLQPLHATGQHARCTCRPNNHTQSCSRHMQNRQTQQKYLQSLLPTEFKHRQWAPTLRTWLRRCSWRVKRLPQAWHG